MNMPFHSIRIGVLGATLLFAGMCWADKIEGAEKQPPTPASPAGDEADHDALRALVPMYEQAANEGKPALLKPYLDPEFSGVMVTGEEVDSFASLEDYWAKIQKLMGSGGKYRVKVNVATRSILSGNLAVARGTTNDDVITSSGKEYHFEGRWTAVCRKQDGQWKVLRVHGSMDPIFNPFVGAAVRASSISTGAIAGVVCLVVGWFVHVLWSRRRKAVAST
jgi:ketosteroid isomerase-like protein